MNLLYTARSLPIDAAQGCVNVTRRFTDQLGFDAENLDSSMEQLSRGQQQKVAIARAFLTSPRLKYCWTLTRPRVWIPNQEERGCRISSTDCASSRMLTLILTTHRI